jgi:LAS superfamily LD-carboxypeptidase LdcB
MECPQNNRQLEDTTGSQLVQPASIASQQQQPNTLPVQPPLQPGRGRERRKLLISSLLAAGAMFIPRNIVAAVSSNSKIEDLLKRGLEELGVKQNAILLYPVSKFSRLPDTFPDKTAIAPLARAENNITVAAMILDPLMVFLREARAAGFSPYLASGFRSIQEQQDVFTHWVKQEMEHGSTQEEAEAKTCTYSAKPGYSEHHLGTAVDILASSNDEEWDRARENFNAGLYGWIRNNAHLYGFVISYPTGYGETRYSKSGSGYPSAEPWHLRFVGRTIAGYLYRQDYLDPQATITVNSFLEESLPRLLQLKI